MEVGEDESPLVDDDARPEARLPEFRSLSGGVRSEELLEEVLEERIVARLRRNRPARLGALHRADVHDRRAELLGHPHEGGLQRFGQGGACRRARGQCHRRANQDTIPDEVPGEGGRQHQGEADESTEEGAVHVTGCGWADHTHRPQGVSSKAARPPPAPDF